VRRGDTQVSEVAAEPVPRAQAMVALAAVRASIDELDNIAGRLARSATELGGSWSDVASSLGLAEDAARRATTDRVPSRGDQKARRSVRASLRYSPAVSSASANALGASETAA
jgi:hypothetical protein